MSGFSTRNSQAWIAFELAVMRSAIDLRDLGGRSHAARGAVSIQKDLHPTTRFFWLGG